MRAGYAFVWLSVLTNTGAYFCYHHGLKSIEHGPAAILSVATSVIAFAFITPRTARKHLLNPKLIRAGAAYAIGIWSLFAAFGNLTPGDVTTLTRTYIVWALLLGFLRSTKPLERAEWICAGIAVSGFLMYFVSTLDANGTNASPFMICAVLSAFAFAFGDHAFSGNRSNLRMKSGSLLMANLWAGVLLLPLFLIELFMLESSEEFFSFRFWPSFGAIAFTLLLGLLLHRHFRRRSRALETLVSQTLVVIRKSAYAMIVPGTVLLVIVAADAFPWAGRDAIVEAMAPAMWIVFGALLASVLGFLLNLFGIERIAIERASMIRLTRLPITAVLTFIFLEHSFNGLQFGSMCLILWAAYRLMHLNRQPGSKETDSPESEPSERNDGPEHAALTIETPSPPHPSESEPEFRINNTHERGH